MRGAFPLWRRFFARTLYFLQILLTQQEKLIGAMFKVALLYLEGTVA